MLRVITLTLFAHAVSANTLSKHHKTQMLRVQKTTTHNPEDLGTGDHTTWTYDVMCINCFEPSKITRAPRTNSKGWEITRPCVFKSERLLLQEGLASTCGTRDSNAAQNVRNTAMCTNNDESHAQGCSLDRNPNPSSRAEAAKIKILKRMRPHDEPSGTCCKSEAGGGMCRQDNDGACSAFLPGPGGAKAKHTEPVGYLNHELHEKFETPCADFNKFGKIRCPVSSEEADPFNNGLPENFSK